MKTRRALLMSMMIWCAPVLPVAGVLTAQSAVAQQQVSAEVGKPLQDAQADMKRGRWDGMLAKLKQAEAASNKTAYEKYLINELKAYAYNQKRDVPRTLAAYEENLESGQTPPADLRNRLKLMTQLALQVKDHKKVVEYGKRWIKAGGSGDADSHYLVAQSLYELGDNKQSLKFAETAIKQVISSGRTPSENWLKLKLDLQRKLGDKSGMADTYAQMVRYYPKPDYWNALLMQRADPDADDRTKLALARLKLELGALRKPGDYVDMAMVAMDNHQYQDAVNILDKGFANKVLGATPNEAERHNRLLKAARDKAQQTAAAVTKLEKEVSTGKDGQKDVDLGNMYMSQGQYDKAVQSITRGLQKGGVKHADEAQVLLGRAYLAQGKKVEASKAFKSVPQDSKLASVANLWALHAQQS